MIVVYTPAEVVTVLSALNVMQDVYREIIAKEKDPAERAILQQNVAAAEHSLTYIRAIQSDRDVEVELVGRVSLVERALRMLANKWQAMITAKMPPAQKALHRESADEVAAVLRKTRKARGLPW